MLHYKQEEFNYEIKRREKSEQNRELIKQEYEDFILENTMKTNKIKDEQAMRETEITRLSKIINIKEVEYSKLQMKLEEIQNDNYKFKDILDNKTEGQRDLLKQISNLKIEISKLKDAITLKEREIERTEQSKLDMKG